MPQEGVLLLMGTMTMEQTAQSQSLAIAIAKHVQELIHSASRAILDSILILMPVPLVLETVQFVQAEQSAATVQHIIN
jgi:hypothetical protein